MGTGNNETEHEDQKRRDDIRIRRAAWNHRGSLSPHRTRVTPQQRQDIGRRLRAGEKAQELAAEFHISTSYVYYLRDYH